MPDDSADAAARGLALLDIHEVRWMIRPLTD